MKAVKLHRPGGLDCLHVGEHQEVWGARDGEVQSSIN